MFRHISEDSNGTENHGFKSDNANGKSVLEIPTQIQITRSVYDQNNLHHEMVYMKTPNVESRCNNITSRSFWKLFLKTFPIFSWLYSYKREYFTGDIISGATVCALHLPGMGHALLANLPPVVGIYMGFYPVLIYGIFASSKHNSIGTNEINA